MVVCGQPPYFEQHCYSFASTTQKPFKILKCNQQFKKKSNLFNWSI